MTEPEEGGEDTIRATVKAETKNDIEDLLVSKFGRDPRKVYGGYTQDTLEVVLETLEDIEE